MKIHLWKYWFVAWLLLLCFSVSLRWKDKDTSVWGLFDWPLTLMFVSTALKKAFVEEESIMKMAQKDFIMVNVVVISPSHLLTTYFPVWNLDWFSWT